MANVLITGANRGTGFFMARQLLKENNKVAVLDLETDGLCELKETYSDNLLAYVCDVSSQMQADECVTRAA